MSSQSVLIIGASGYMGSCVAREFREQKSKFARAAILADPSKASKYAQEAEAGMEIVVGSYFDSSSFKDFTTVISMLGNRAVCFQPAIIEAAASAGVTHFYPSEYGGDISHEMCRRPPWIDKLVTRQALEKVSEKYQGFGYTYILCCAFAEFLTTHAFGFVREENKYEFYGDVNKQIPFTGIADVAKYIVASVLTIPPLGTTPSRGRTLKIAGMCHTWVEVAEITSRVTGRECKIEQRPISEAYQLAEKHAREGDIAKEAEYALKAFIGEPRVDPLPKPWDNEKFPDVEPESLEICLQRAIAAEK